MQKELLRTEPRRTSKSTATLSFIIYIVYIYIYIHNVRLGVGNDIFNSQACLRPEERLLNTV
jgi:hypothetical protein